MADKIRTIIVDDEPLARRNLRLLLEKDLQIEIVDECANGLEAVKAIKSLSPDLIFLDIQMPEIDGFDVLERVGAEHIHAIIFVTAFDQYALKAFEVHALDYLLKPFDDARFTSALQLAKVQIEEREIDKLSKRLLALLEDRESQRGLPKRPKPYLTRLMIKLAKPCNAFKSGRSRLDRGERQLRKASCWSKIPFAARKNAGPGSPTRPETVCPHPSPDNRQSGAHPGATSSFQQRLHSSA
jgi:YesN/AraC family two-component response regulator